MNWIFAVAVAVCLAILPLLGLVLNEITVPVQAAAAFLVVLTITLVWIGRRS
jgi:hypothetical protein